MIMAIDRNSFHEPSEIMPFLEVCVQKCGDALVKSTTLAFIHSDAYSLNK